jgi:hypothetical protein
LIAARFGAVIVVDSHDTVTLPGVTVAQLQAAPNLILFLLIEALTSGPRRIAFTDSAAGNDGHPALAPPA